MNRIKYPRTHHLPWSPGATDDDKMLDDCSHFVGRRVIVTKKMDGENTTIYPDGYVHARSLDSQGGIDRDWVKAFAQRFCYSIPDGWRVCGENLWAKHSIHYDDLPSYFLCFGIWDNTNRCLRWDDVVVWCTLLGIEHVPVLFDGIWDESAIQALEKKMDSTKDEGYVVRLASEFKYDEFKTSAAKFVRPNHVQTDKHWRTSGHFIPNALRNKDDL